MGTYNDFTLTENLGNNHYLAVTGRGVWPKGDLYYFGYKHENGIITGSKGIVLDSRLESGTGSYIVKIKTKKPIYDTNIFIEFGPTEGADGPQNNLKEYNEIELA